MWRKCIVTVVLLGLSWAMAGCEDEDARRPAPPATPPATGPAETAAEKAEAAARKAGQAAGRGLEAAGEAIGQAGREVQTRADAGAGDLQTRAQTLIAQARDQISRKSLEQAEQTLQQLEQIKASLSAELQEEINRLRASLTEVRQAAT